MCMSEQEVCLLQLLFMECVISYHSLPFPFGILLIDIVSNLGNALYAVILITYAIGIVLYICLFTTFLNPVFLKSSFASLL